MSLLRTTRHRLTLPLAALLLGLQALGGGAVALAHATEPSSAPAAFEAHHTASCPVLHDAARCALCQYAGLRVTLASATAPASEATTAVRPFLAATESPVPSDQHLTAPPRAPPVVS